MDTEGELFFFSEEKYMIEKPELFDEERCELLRQMPEVKNIYEFMKGLYECGQFRYTNPIISFLPT